MPSFGGEVASLARTGNIDEAKKVLEYYKEVYGSSKDPKESNLFIEITRHDDVEDHKVTMRDRDSGEQSRISIDEIITQIQLKTKLSF